MKKILLYTLGSLLLLACNDVGTSHSVYGDSGSSLPSLKIDGGSWGGDFTINVAKTSSLSNDRTEYTLLSRYGNEPVGFYLILREPEKKSEFVSEGVTLRPMRGDTSNNFLTVLAQIYGVRRSNLIFADTVVATYADLSVMAGSKTPGSWAAAQFKLFFGDGSAELYMNIDRNAGTIAFPEKDSANRADLVDALAKAKVQNK